MTGVVDQRGLAIISVTLWHRLATHRLDIDALLDTGCELEFVLSSADIAALSLPFAHSIDIELADGTSSLVRVFDGAIDWFGSRRPIKILESATDLPLLGAGLLQNHTVIIDYPAKVVTIH